MPRYSTVTGKRYGPYHTSVNIRRGTADKLLIPVLDELEETTGDRPAQGALLDEMIHFFVQHKYPDIYFAYTQEQDRGASNGKEGPHDLRRQPVEVAG